ncbi:MAG: hypothetical protein GF311_13445 [Candidatus Lokiarchaeota archaeon]|nr:hypothetical protein [Candidatus Lokiarchaeota archaeon]
MEDRYTHSELLAQFRTLLALERNYLAEERTVLAAFRTGLALILLMPSLYIYSIALNWQLNFYLQLIFYVFLGICGILGTWESLRSRVKLKILRRLKIKVINKEKEILKSSNKIREIFAGLMNFPIDDKKRRYILKRTNNGFI